MTILLLLVSVGLASTALTEVSTAAAKAAPRQVSAKYTYYIATANGGVRNFGGARFYGSARHLDPPAPIVGISSTRDLLGYWLVGSLGAVYAYGDARSYGSLAGRITAPDHLVALLPTADDRGYWLVDANGVITPFGDAQPIGPDALPPADLSSPIVGAASLPNGLGAWLTNAAGQVFTVGRAISYGSLAGQHLKSPVTGMAATPSGLGYWLTEADGATYAFGDATGGGPAVQGLPGTVVGITPAEDRFGYWEVSSAGYVVAGGDATSQGSLDIQSGSPVVGISLAEKYVPPPSNYPPGSIGYDINWPQCGPNGSSQAGTLPGPPRDAAGSLPYTVAIVGVDGWAVGSYNPCLAAEVAWAQQATEPAGQPAGTPPYELYLFLNSPSSASTIDRNGPAGTCSQKTGSAKSVCLTYNYGYNAAVDALAYASSQGASAKIWWLDIENDACAPGIYNDAGQGEFWSCNQSLNSETVQGAIDALRAAGRTPGIYSTAVQYQGITGNYTPTGGSGPLPLWVAGAYWTNPPYPNTSYPGPSVNTGYCAGGSYAFAGGTPVLLQETPGPNNYPFDPDLAC